MKSETKHFVVSMLKSGLRMISCLIVLLCGSRYLWVLPVGLFIAEMLGILEELVVF